MEKSLRVNLTVEFNYSKRIDEEHSIVRINNNTIKDVDDTKLAIQNSAYTDER